MKLSFLSIIYGFPFPIKEYYYNYEAHWAVTEWIFVLFTDDLQTTTVLLTDHLWSSGISGWGTHKSRNYLRSKPNQKMD